MEECRAHDCFYQGMTGIHHYELDMSLKIEDIIQRTHPQITQTSTTLDCSLIFINVLIWNFLELSIHLIIVPGSYTFSFSLRMPCYLHLLEATLLPQFSSEINSPQETQEKMILRLKEMWYLLTMPKAHKETCQRSANNDALCTLAVSL